MRGMRNAYYVRNNFDVRRGGRGFSCAVKNTLISQKDAVDTCTFRVKPNTSKLLSMPGKNGGQLWDLPSISMNKTDGHNLDLFSAFEHQYSHSNCNSACIQVSHNLREILLSGKVTDVL